MLKVIAVFISEQLNLSPPDRPRMLKKPSRDAINSNKFTKTNCLREIRLLYY